jgi:hypothetical protein
MKANGSKSIQVTFTTRKETCPPPVHINNVQLPKKMSSILTGDLPGTNTFRKTETARNQPHQQLKEKSAATALNTVFASVHIQMT